MKTEKLLEDLENLIETSGRIPMTTKRVIEEEEIMRVLDAINESLPLELEESRRIMAEKDKIGRCTAPSRYFDCSGQRLYCKIDGRKRTC